MCSLESWPSGSSLAVGSGRGSPIVARVLFPISISIHIHIHIYIRIYIHDDGDGDIDVDPGHVVVAPFLLPGGHLSRSSAMHHFRPSFPVLVSTNTTTTTTTTTWGLV
jgi:hypothetical protein